LKSIVQIERQLPLLDDTIFSWPSSEAKRLKEQIYKENA